jgi:GH18 family chitinase
MSTPASSFRVIAYATEAIVVDLIPFDRLTHINYAFLIPNDDGSFANLNNPWKLTKIVKQAHSQGVKVFISVGGWGWDEQFEQMAIQKESRSAFIGNLVDFVEEYNLDGADIDWEYPNPEQSAEFLSLMSELREALPADKMLTAAVIAYGDEYGLGIPLEAFELMDFVNIMTYDGPDHGTMEQFEKGLDYWSKRGLPPEKIVLGVPFYARPDGTPYSRLVDVDPAAAASDSFELYGVQLHYNGIPTIQIKTRLAMEHVGGIMFWALDHDSQDEDSLLLAIDQIVSGEIE